MDAFQRIFEATHCRTQSQLAALLGVKQSSVSVAIRRKSVPPAWLITLVRTHGISPEWVLTGSGSRRLQGADLSELGRNNLKSAQDVVRAGGDTPPPDSHTSSPPDPRSTYTGEPVISLPEAKLAAWGLFFAKVCLSCPEKLAELRHLRENDEKQLLSEANLIIEEMEEFVQSYDATA